FAAKWCRTQAGLSTAAIKSGGQLQRYKSGRGHCTLHASLETASRERIPKGFRPKAQGCEERATLGARLGHVFNPERVVASGFPPFDAIAAQATTLSGLNMFSRGLSPRVARSSQPWAGGHNPFGIEDACKVQRPRAQQRGKVRRRWDLLCAAGVWTLLRTRTGALRPPVVGCSSVERSAYAALRSARRLF